MTGRWRTRWIKLTALVVCSYLGLVVADVALRLVPGGDRHARNVAAAGAAGIPFDTRTGWEVIEDLRAGGVRAYPFVSPPHFLRGDLEAPVERGERFLPLGGISGVVTVACNETGTWMVYEADEHGFNNPAGLYDGSPTIVAVGDSFTHGTCMARGDEFASILRDTLGPTLTLGTYGSGPVLMLAQIREYAARLRPPLVLWFYFEGNDVVTDVRREMADPTLRRYLEPDFSQRLFDRQASIDRLVSAQIRPPARAVVGPGTSWARAALAVVALRDVRTVAAKAVGRAIRFDAFRSLWFEDKYAGPLRQFDAALTRARDDVRGWGGRLVFVYLPSWEAFHAPWHDGAALKPAVLDVAAARGIPVIDVEPAFRALDDPAEAFALGLANHYGVVGNRIVADEVVAGLRALGAVPDAPEGVKSLFSRPGPPAVRPPVTDGK